MAATVESGSISLESYRQIEFVIGTAVDVQVNKKARVPAYHIALDVGEKLMQEHKESFKKDAYLSSAQLTENHSVLDLTSQQVLCVANFPRKQIGSRKSDCLVTGVQDPNFKAYEKKRLTTVAVTASEEVPNGSLVRFGRKEEVLESNKRKLDWETFIQADLRVGTVKGAKLVEISEKIQRILLEVDFGPSGTLCTIANWSQVPEGIIGEQVLGVVNIHHEELQKRFHEDATALLCSPKDGVWLTPLIPVENGYKLA